MLNKKIVPLTTSRLKSKIVPKGVSFMSEMDCGAQGGAQVFDETLNTLNGLVPEKCLACNSLELIRLNLAAIVAEGNMTGQEAAVRVQSEVGKCAFGATAWYDENFSQGSTVRIHCGRDGAACSGGASLPGAHLATLADLQPKDIL
jgi:hypothetical protein